MKPMTRRTFIRQAGLAAAASMLGPQTLHAADPTKSARPNVLLVINDDQSWRECSAYGHASVQTPHFDRVARDGVLFNYAYTSAPSCAPSRASLLTGHNFWELEQGAFIQAWLPSKYPVLPDLLEGAGYHTGFTGKGWGPGVLPQSGRTKNPAGHPYNRLKRKPPEEGIGPFDYVANFKEFLDARPAGKPFYFWAGLIEPHHPHAKDNYKKLGVKLDDIEVPGFLPDTPGVRRSRANYLYEVRHADNTLGALLKILEERGELENTLVIVTADNGTPVVRSKASAYDWGVHEPLAMMWPARIAKGRRVDDFVNFRDLTPTILEAAGVPVPKTMSGRSAMNVLLDKGSGQVDPARDCTVTGLEWHGRTLAARSIRDHQYQYIVNYTTSPLISKGEQEAQMDENFERAAATRDVGPLIRMFPDHPSIKRIATILQSELPREELYDCVADPWQLNNLAGTEAFASVKEKLRARLEAYQRETKDPRITGDMTLFDETNKFVTERKKKNYRD